MKTKLLRFEDYIDIGEKEYGVIVEGTAYAGSPATSSWDCPMGYPGDPAESEVHHVWAMLPTGPWDTQKSAYIEEKIDLVNVIHDDLLKNLESKLLDQLEENRGRDNDRWADEDHWKETIEPVGKGLEDN